MSSVTSTKSVSSSIRQPTPPFSDQASKLQSQVEHIEEIFQQYIINEPTNDDSSDCEEDQEETFLGDIKKIPEAIKKTLSKIQNGAHKFVQDSNRFCKSLSRCTKEDVVSEQAQMLVQSYDDVNHCYVQLSEIHKKIISAMLVLPPEITNDNEEEESDEEKSNSINIKKAQWEGAGAVLKIFTKQIATVRQTYISDLLSLYNDSNETVRSFLYSVVEDHLKDCSAISKMYFETILEQANDIAQSQNDNQETHNYFPEDLSPFIHSISHSVYDVELNLFQYIQPLSTLGMDERNDYDVVDYFRKLSALLTKISQAIEEENEIKYTLLQPILQKMQPYFLRSILASLQESATWYESFVAENSKAIKRMSKEQQDIFYEQAHDFKAHADDRTDELMSIFQDFLEAASVTVVEMAKLYDLIVSIGLLNSNDSENEAPSIEDSLIQRIGDELSNISQIQDTIIEKFEGSLDEEEDGENNESVETLLDNHQKSTQDLLNALRIAIKAFYRRASDNLTLEDQQEISFEQDNNELSQNLFEYVQKLEGFLNESYSDLSQTSMSDSASTASSQISTKFRANRIKLLMQPKSNIYTASRIKILEDAISRALDLSLTCLRNILMVSIRNVDYSQAQAILNNLRTLQVRHADHTTLLKQAATISGDLDAAKSAQERIENGKSQDDAILQETIEEMVVRSIEMTIANYYHELGKIEDSHHKNKSMLDEELETSFSKLEREVHIVDLINIEKACRIEINKEKVRETAAQQELKARYQNLVAQNKFDEAKAEQLKLKKLKRRESEEKEKEIQRKYDLIRKQKMASQEQDLNNLKKTYDEKQLQLEMKTKKDIKELNNLLQGSILQQIQKFSAFAIKMFPESPKKKGADGSYSSFKGSREQSAKSRFIKKYQMLANDILVKNNLKPIAEK